MSAPKYLQQAKQEVADWLAVLNLQPYATHLDTFGFSLSFFINQSVNIVDDRI